MSRLPRLVTRILVAVAAAVVLLPILALFLAFEESPRVLDSVAPSAEEIDRLKRTLGRQDPRRLEAGQIGTLALSERDLGIAMNQSLELLGFGQRAFVDVEPEAVVVRMTVELPTDLDRRFLNVDMVLRETEELPRFERLRLGRTRVPAWLAEALWRRAAASWLERLGSEGLLETVEGVALGKDRIEVTYRWEPATVARLRAGLLSDVDRSRLRAFSDRLAAITSEHDSGEIPLADLLGPLLELAARRSRNGEAAAENRSAILVLGFYVDGRRLESLVPEAEDWPRARKLEATLHRHHDLARHFMMSALLASVGGSRLSNSVGLSKELEDVRGGSGFSFQDLAADRAGTRFGEAATGSEASAVRCQSILAAELTDSDLLGRVDDLPDSLSQQEFERLVGSVGTPAYQRLIAEIERRLDGSPLCRSR